MPDRIFLVHGMGNQGAGWHRPAEKLLRDFYKKYANTRGKTFDTRFRVVPISYDDVFKDILSTWQKRGSELLQVGQKFGTDKADQLLGWTQDAPEVDKNFFWTHAFDVILYRMFSTVREAVKVHVANAMFKELENLASSESWSVIGHSLGTIVVHDTLHAWYTQPVGDAGQLGMHKRPRLVMMAANVSRILQTSPKVLEPESTVRPGEACEFYYNAYHPLDPFTVLRPFKPVVWPDRQRYENHDYRLIEVNHIQEANIHDLVHYLRHPDVVISLFRGLRYSSFVTRDKEEEYRSAFKPWGKLKDPQLVEIRKGLEDLAPSVPADSETWETLLVIWERFDQIRHLV